MELELEGEDGSRIQLKNDSSHVVFGRGSSGLNTKDRTVSRRHVVFQLDEGEPQKDPNRVPFQVIGKNPVWVRSGGTVTVFRKLEKGEVSKGDRLCVSSQNPVWFRLKRVGLHGDVSGIDPVKEFGFLVIGHEFDGYGKGRIREAKDWDWFLEENGGGSEEEENGGNLNQGSKKRGGKRKLTGGAGANEDEDWTGESDEDKEVVAKARKVDSTKMYATRSKHRKGEGSLGKRKDAGYNGEENDEDEDDETLGGFIVDEDDKEEEVGEIDEEEEEFIDYEEEEED